MKKFKPLNCECGGKIRLNKCMSDGFFVDCMKCDKCHEEMFTLNQARNIIDLREANKKIKGKRKIIKVGSSIAALLPKKLKEYGVKEGLVDEVNILSTNSLVIKFKKDII